MRTARTVSVLAAIVAALVGLWQPAALAVTWEEYIANPIITGTAEAYYPTVLYDAQQFSGCGEAAPYKLWCDKKFQYYTSDDGVSWTLIGSTVDAVVTGVKSTIRHPLVEYYPDGFSGVNSGINPSAQTMYYRLWYWDSQYIYTVAAMRYGDSPDGKTWFNDQPLQNGAVPIISGSMAVPWCRGTYGPSDVLYFPGASNTGTDWTFRMYYDGTTGGDEATGLGFSADGIVWTAYDPDSDGKANPVFSGTFVSGDWDYDYASRCTVQWAEGQYHMWYSGGSASMNQGIGYATSADGMTWTRDASNPVFYRTDAGGDSLSAAYWRYSGRTYTPMVVYDSAAFAGNGDARLYKMWFTGEATWNGLGSVVGYARDSQPISLAETIGGQGHWRHAPRG